MFSAMSSATRKSTLRICVSVGAFVFASEKSAMASLPIGGMCVIGISAGFDAGPRTQQQAGRSRSDKRMVVAVVAIAMGFQESGRGISRTLPTCRLPNGNRGVPHAYHPFVIEVINLTKSYGSLVAVDAVSFTVKSGHIL